MNNPEFEVHVLNPNGLAKANEIAVVFDDALNKLKQLVPIGREFSIVKTKMEEACFFAKKGMASSSENNKA